MDNTEENTPKRRKRKYLPGQMGIGEIFEELINTIRRTLTKIMNLAADTDIEGTISGIKSGVVLEGSNLWILICSSMIACIGLDTNSPAVIIGAMLISPLMSPILGIGLSLGINDREYLIKSLRNFSIATALSLLTSFVYFQLTPFGEFTDEMRGRIHPTILDAFVALFGGLAGIIAGSRAEKTNAIPGVAIATALKPPLCTSGFGLATGRWDVFAGAFYLFFINAILISLSTYIIVRALKFPYIEQLDARLAGKAKRVVYFILFLILIPSVVFLLESMKDVARNKIIDEFVSENVHEDINKGVEWTYKMEGDSLRVLRIYYFGEYIHDDSVTVLKDKLEEVLNSSLLVSIYDRTPHDLELITTDAPPDLEKEQMNIAIEDLTSRVIGLEHNHELEQEKHAFMMDSLNSEIHHIRGDTIKVHDITSELKALYPELQFLTIGKAHATAMDSLKEMPDSYIALLSWKKKHQ